MRLDQPSFDFEAARAARAARDAGMAQAQAHADNVQPGWTETAFANVVALCRAGCLTTPTLTEDIRAQAYLAGLPPPPDGRAWGPVILRAYRQGLLQHVGFGAAKSSRLGPKSLWVAAS